jgi:hypothetical protein
VARILIPSDYDVVATATVRWAGAADGEFGE